MLDNTYNRLCSNPNYLTLVGIIPAGIRPNPVATFIRRTFIATLQINLLSIKNCIQIPWLHYIPNTMFSFRTIPFLILTIFCIMPILWYAFFAENRFLKCLYTSFKIVVVLQTKCSWCLKIGRVRIESNERTNDQIEIHIQVIWIHCKSQWVVTYRRAPVGGPHLWMLM